MTIRDMQRSDFERLIEIFTQGISGNLATFTTAAPSWESWNAAHAESCRLVAEENGEVIGWAALTPHGGACAYSGVAEVSIYIDEKLKGKGAGRALLEALITASEREGYWTLEAVIVAENTPSRALFEASGFRYVGYRKKIGRTPDGVWHDTVIYERRSEAVARQSGVLSVER